MIEKDEVERIMKKLTQVGYWVEEKPKRRLVEIISQLPEKIKKEEIGRYYNYLSEKNKSPQWGTK